MCIRDSLNSNQCICTANKNSRYEMSRVSLLSAKLQPKVLRIAIALTSHTDHIVIHKEDTPKSLARAFCSKHGLGRESEERLIGIISQRMDEVLMEGYGKTECRDVQEIGEESEEESQESVSELEGVATLSQINDKSCIAIPSELKKPFTPLNNSPQKMRRDIGTTQSSCNAEPKGNKQRITPAKSSMLRKQSTIASSFSKSKSNLCLDAKQAGKISCYNSKTTKNLSSHKRKISCGELPSSKTCKSRFESLYQQALIQRERREMLVKRNKELKEIEEMKQATFRPEISHYKSKAIITQRKQCEQKKLAASKSFCRQSTLKLQ
eukprot:TRINITY_DN9816_c0_g1_i8.p1 TRINITY_DN9816_c0_g1~~TRINITY_DN9816_c0_g1_i8.p1  ORF type:complete len:323 (+),score=70.74 TRINITY_DN9816_c0_g1_i8:73-1041(+)